MKSIGISIALTKSRSVNCERQALPRKTYHTSCDDTFKIIKHPPLASLRSLGRTRELDRNAKSSLDIWMTVWPTIIIIAAGAKCCHTPALKSCQTAVHHSDTKILNTIARQLSILSNPKCHCMPTYENCQMPSVKSEILKLMFKIKCVDLHLRPQLLDAYWNSEGNFKSHSQYNLKTQDKRKFGVSFLFSTRTYWGWPAKLSHTGASLCSWKDQGDGPGFLHRFLPFVVLRFGLRRPGEMYPSC